MAELTPEAAAERERVRQLMTLPVLAALRCIPDGRIQKGCVISDGAQARERLRLAYIAVIEGAEHASPPAGDPS
jgi:hypothetical protein